jgi:hypothetical protein
MGKDCCTTLDTIFIQLKQIFFKLIIRSIFLHATPTYQRIISFLKLRQLSLLFF